MAETPQYGRLEVPVEFSTKHLKASSQQVTEEIKRQGRTMGTEQVRAYTEAAERQFKLDMARIKEGQARGLLTPAEAAKAGREAGIAYNQAMIRTIDTGTRGGAFRGAAGKELFEEVAGSIKNVDAAARGAEIGQYRLRNAFTYLLRSASGMNPALAQIIHALGLFAVGSLATLGILSGLAVIATWFKRMQDAANDFRAAVEKSREALGDLANEQEFGPEFGTLKNMANARADRELLREKMQPMEDRVEGFRNRLQFGGSEAVAAQAGIDVIEEKLAPLRAELAAMDREIAAGQKHIDDAEAERDKKTEEGRIRDQEKLDREKERLAREREQALDRLAKAEDQVQDRLTALTATAEDELLRAIDQLEAEGIKAAAEAGTEVSAAFLEGIAKLREDASHQAALEPLQQRFAVITRDDPSVESQAALAALIEELRKEAGALAAASSARARYNELLSKAEELHERNTESLKREAEQERNAAKAAGAAAKQKAKSNDREQLEALRDRARALEENARAALQLANAIGVISDKTMAALENLVQLGGAIARIAGGDLTAIPAAIGSAAQLVKGLFAEDQDLKDDIASLTKALRDLEGAILKELSATERANILVQGERIAAAGGKPTDADRAIIERIAKVLGTGVDTFFTDAGRVRRDQLREALDQLAKMDLGVFDHTVKGQIQGRRFEESIAGGGPETPAEQQARFDRFLADMSKVGAGSFADAVRAALVQGGPEAADAMIDQWAERLAAGDQTLFDVGGPFAGLSADDVRALLEEGNTLLEEWLDGGGASGVTQDFVQARSITEVTAGRLLGLDTTRNVLLTQIRDILASEMGVDPSTLVGGGIPSMTAAAQPGPPRGSAGGVSIHVGTLIDGGITVNAEHGIVDAAQVQAQVSQMVMTGLEGAMDEVDRRLGQRYLGRRRAGGRNG